MQSLDGRRVLIVEDNPTLAAGLVRHVRRAGAMVLGPVPGWACGPRLLGLAEAALLDIRHGGGAVFPLAERLRQAGVPVVFHAGPGLGGWPDRPASGAPDDLAAHVAAVLARPEPQLAARAHLRVAFRPTPPDEPEVASHFPLLRAVARLAMDDDPAAADRLVERALQRALGDHGNRNSGISLGDWLMRLLLDTALHDHRSLMH